MRAGRFPTRAEISLRGCGMSHLRPVRADVDYGLTIDGNGSRLDTFSLALQDRSKRVQVVAIDEAGDAAFLTWTPGECREIAEWLWAAAARLEEEA